MDPVGAGGFVEKLKSDLDEVQSRLAALESAHAQETHDGGYSVGATFCSATSNMYTGSFSYNGLTGYAAAKAICDGTCPGSHMCTGEEVVRSGALGVSGTASGYGWYAGAYRSNDTNPVTDCSGWTASSSTVSGPATQVGTWNPTDLSCSQSVPIFCCR